MAVRSATRRYPDLGSFYADYQATLRVGALLLPAGTIEGEPAPNMKVDLVIPIVGRIGPIDGQLVQQMADGSAALRVQDMPPAVAEAAKTAREIIEPIKTWLLASGQVSLPDKQHATELAELRAVIAAQAGQIAELQARKPEVIHVRAPAPSGGGAVAQVASGPRERGLQLPDLRGVPIAYEGKMGDESMRDSLMAIAVRKETGILTIRLPDGRVKYGFWSKGGVVGWRTEPIDQEEVLGILLFRSNQITKEQLEESLTRMERDDCRQGEALIEMGVFGFAQLVMILQKQAEFVLQRVLAMKAGTMTFHVVPELPERFVNPPIRVAAMLYKQLKSGAKTMAAEELSGGLRPMLDQYVFVRPGSERVLEEMRLSADEQQFVKIVGSTSYRLREVFSVSNLSRSVTAYTVWCFALLGLLEFRGEEARERVADRVARMIENRKATIDHNFFDRLDLHWMCTTEEVESAWARLGSEFAPDKVAVYGAAHATTINRIYGAMKEAYETLRDGTKRREYRATLIEGPMITQSAFMLAEKGDMAFMKESRREALECFSKAAELIPTNARFREGLQRAQQMPG